MMKKMMTQIWMMILNINKKHMTLEHITIERLQEIEAERAQTQQNPEFQAWMQQLKVGRLCVDRDGIVKANQMMQEWKTCSNLNTSLWE